MKIPQTAIISKIKFTKYLLLKRDSDDKSKFLQNAGFTLENYYILIDELIALIGREEAIKEKENLYGILYSVTGTISGPNGKRLSIVTIWLYNNEDDRYHFVTLRPLRG